MTKDNSSIKKGQGVSRRTFLRVSAFTGGSAAAQLTGLPRLAALEKYAADLTAFQAVEPAAQAEGNEYWVWADSAYTGEPTGAPDKPFKTIQAALDMIDKDKADRVYDTIFVKGGSSYNEQLLIGDKKTGLSIIGVPNDEGQKPIIDGEEKKPAGAFVDGSKGNYKDRNGIEQEAKGWVEAALVSIRAGHFRFENIDVKNSLGQGLRLTPTTRVSIEDITIKDCSVSNCRNSGLLLSFNDTDNSKTCHSVLIENCDISGSGNFYPHLRGDLKDEKGNPVPNWPGALSIRGCYGVSVINTRVHENWGEGIMADTNKGRSTDVHIRECELYDNMRASVYVHGSKNVTVERSFIYHSTTQALNFSESEGINISGKETGKGYGEDPVEDILILNNVIVGFGYNIVLALRKKDALVLKNERVRILYNTLVNATQYGLYNAHKLHMDCELRNNVFYQTNGQQPAYLGPEGNFDGWTISHNAWWRGDLPDAVRSPYDFTLNPMLVSPIRKRDPGSAEPGWYALTAESLLPELFPGNLPTLAALGLRPARIDFFGRKRDKLPDMGAHEFRNKIRTWDYWRPFHDENACFQEIVVGKNGDGRLEAFSVSCEGTVWHTWQRAKGWNGEWIPLHSEADKFSGLVVGTKGDGLLELFGRDCDGAVWHTWQRADGWNGEWLPLHSEADRFGRLAVGTNEDGRLELFGLDDEGAIWHTWQRADGWNNEWVLLLPAPYSVMSMSVARNHDGRLELCAVAPDWSPWHIWQRADGWSSWAPLHSQTQRFKQLLAAPGKDAWLYVFGRSVDDSVWWTRQTSSGWTDWQRLLSEYDRFGQLAVGLNSDGRLEPFGLDDRCRPWHLWQTFGGDWRPWIPLHHSKDNYRRPEEDVFKSVAVDAGVDGRLEVFAISDDNSVWHTIQT